MLLRGSFARIRVSDTGASYFDCSGRRRRLVQVDVRPSPRSRIDVYTIQNLNGKREQQRVKSVLDLFGPARIFMDSAKSLFC